MGNTKLKILEVLIKNRSKNFDFVRVELMQTFPDMSWADLKDYMAFLQHDGFIKILYADDDIFDIAVQPGAKARLQDFFETAESEKQKTLIAGILNLFKISLP